MKINGYLILKLIIPILDFDKIQILLKIKVFEDIQLK